MLSIENRIGEGLVRSFGESASMLDENNILWKFKGGNWTGKRSVWTIRGKACWIDEVKPEEIEAWWCGEKSDYNEILTRC